MLVPPFAKVVLKRQLRFYSQYRTSLWDLAGILRYLSDARRTLPHRAEAINAVSQRLTQKYCPVVFTGMTRHGL